MLFREIFLWKGPKFGTGLSELTISLIFTPFFREIGRIVLESGKEVMCRKWANWKEREHPVQPGAVDVSASPNWKVCHGQWETQAVARSD